MWTGSNASLWTYRCTFNPFLKVFVFPKKSLPPSLFFNLVSECLFFLLDSSGAHETQWISRKTACLALCWESPAKSGVFQSLCSGTRVHCEMSGVPWKIIRFHLIGWTKKKPFIVEWLCLKRNVSLLPPTGVCFVCIETGFWVTVNKVPILSLLLGVTKCNCIIFLVGGDVSVPFVTSQRDVLQ